MLHCTTTAAMFLFLLDTHTSCFFSCVLSSSPFALPSGHFFYSFTTLPPSSLKSRDKADSYFSGHTKNRRKNNLSSITSVDIRFTEPYRPSKPLRQVTHRTAKIKPTDGHKRHPPTYVLTTAQIRDRLAVTRLK